FTAVLAPTPGARAPIVRRERLLAPLRAPAQFARGPLGAHQRLVLQTPRVAQPQPDEVRDLVRENARKLRPRAVECDAPLAQKCSGMHRPAPVAKTIGPFDPDGSARQFGHASQKLAENKTGGGHPTQGTASGSERKQ